MNVSEKNMTDKLKECFTAGLNIIGKKKNGIMSYLWWSNLQLLMKTMLEIMNMKIPNG